MPTATLMNQKVREIHFNNDLERKHGTNRQLGSSFSFQVNYSPDGERCVAKLYHSLKDKEDEKLFFLSVEMLGVFKCEGVETEEDKKEIHTQCYDQLFPYMQSQCASLASASGIPGLMLRKAVIDPNNIAVNKAGGPPSDRNPDGGPKLTLLE